MSQRILQYEADCRSIHQSCIEFVIQRYITDPDLWHGTHKYHYRVYAALFGDGRLLVHPHAFAHVANTAYTYGGAIPKEFCTDSDGAFATEMHITNVAANINADGIESGTGNSTGCFHGFPTVCLAEEKPFVWENVLRSLVHVCESARPFMSRQRNANHFCYIGADFLVDATGVPWLLELNVPPCLSAQSDCAAYVACVTEVFSQHVYQLFYTILSQQHRDEPRFIHEARGCPEVQDNSKPIQAANSASSLQHAAHTHVIDLCGDVRKKAPPQQAPKLHRLCGTLSHDPQFLEQGCQKCQWQVALDTNSKAQVASESDDVNLVDNSWAWQSFRTASLVRYREHLAKISDSWKNFHVRRLRKGSQNKERSQCSNPRVPKRKSACMDANASPRGTSACQPFTTPYQPCTSVDQSSTSVDQSSTTALRRAAASQMFGSACVGAHQPLPEALTMAPWNRRITFVAPEAVTEQEEGIEE